MLSGVIEAKTVERVNSGGVKFDRVMPQPVAGLKAKDGHGNVPFHRTEYAAESITAYFNLDLAQIRGFGLGEPAERFLIALALFKVRRFLDVGLRLRSACDLDCKHVFADEKRNKGFVLPATDDLAAELPSLINACRDKFAVPAVTQLTWTAPADKKKPGGKGAKETGVQQP